MRFCFVLFLIACDGGSANPDAGDPLRDAGPVVIRDVPRAVTVARATEIPPCTIHVDAAESGGDGSASSPFTTIQAAVDAASDGAVICVAEGTYAESINPGDKAFTLAGGFQTGQTFTVRDSATYVSRAQGSGTGSLLRIEGDVGPGDGELTAIDGFEITGYEQGVVRNFYVQQRFELTNNYIHDNRCPAGRNFGGGFLLTNVTGTISGNVIANNTCGFGGGGAVFDEPGIASSVVFERNRVEGNEGNDADCHGGGIYLLSSELTVSGNDFVANRCASWGGGLYVGALPSLPVTARIEWNFYRDNRAENMGGGFFCDDGATCDLDHEIFVANCGGNVFLDSSYDNADATEAAFDHMTNVGALAVGCGGPGAGVIVNKESDATDTYTFTNSIFWDNGEDVAAFCDAGCATLTVGVTYSIVDRASSGNATVTFGDNIEMDPLFVSDDDLHLRSTFGHWTPDGYVNDAESSPALGAGDPAGDTSQSPDRAGDRTEMGAYGNSPEASYVR